MGLFPLNNRNIYQWVWYYIIILEIFKKGDRLQWKIALYVINMLARSKRQE